MSAIPPAPTSPPTPTSLADKKAFAEMAAASLESTRTSAESWRTGVVGLITLVTAGAFLKGPGEAAELTLLWRSMLTGAIGAGLVFAVWGLWRILAAAAGTPNETTLDDLVQRYGSVEGARIAAARVAADKLRSGRALVARSLALFLLALGLWWWADKEEDAPTHRLTVTTADDAHCGSLDSADGQLVVLEIAGQRLPTEIAFADITNLSVSASCDD